MSPLALVLALTAVSPAAAPAVPALAPAPAAPRLDLVRLSQRQHAARVRRTIGWGLAAAGFAAIAAGAITFWYGETQVNISTHYDEAITDYVAGAGMMAIGLAVAIPGIVLAVQGQAVMSDVQWRIDAALKTALVIPGRSGLVVGARFAF